MGKFTAICRWSVFSAAFALCSTAFAQDKAAVEVFLPPDHLLRRQLDDARTAIEEERYNVAVRLLGDLLIGDPADADDETDGAIEDYFMEPAQEGSAQHSLKAEARQMLASLPPRGLDSFQLLYGREAQLLLESALATGDVERLNEVTRKYFHTESGYQAAMLLGRYHLSQGRPLAAALSLKQLYELPVRNKYEPDLSLLLAASWMLADSPQRAQDIAVALRDRQKGSPLKIAGANVAMFRDDSEALDWLGETLGKIRLTNRQDEQQWLVFRGNAIRNAPTQGGTPLGSERWAVPTPNDLKHQSAISEQQQQYIKQRVPALPSLHPLVVRHPAVSDGKQGGAAFRDIVLTRTASRLIAVDFQTGQRVWFYPPWNDDPSNQESGSVATSKSNAETPQILRLKERTWMDAPYGQLSTDGTNVYFVHQLGMSKAVGPRRIVIAGGGIRGNPASPQTHNELVALGLANEGSKVWSIGGEHGGDEPKLAGAFFLGPPLPLMDRLYAVAEVKGDVRLVVLDPQTGALHWQQQLCGVDSGAILNDPMRRLGGASPSFSEGVLLCPTSAGAVVAVDLAKRSLLWGFQYLIPPENQRNTGFFATSRVSSRSKQPGQAWADSSITIAGDRVLITPVEHDEIICLDLLRGTRPTNEVEDDKPLWRRPRGDGLYVACVHDGNVVIVGTESVVAVDLKRGEQTWKALVPDAPKTMPSGRGFQSGDSYYLPLTSGELAQIDLGGGRLLDVTPTRGILGNVVCYRDTVISQGTTELVSFYQREALGRVVAEKLKHNPDDAWALARQGELLLKEDKRSEALIALRKAYEIDDDDGTKVLLVNTLLDALDDDFAANGDLAEEVESLIDRADQRAAFLRLMAIGLQDVKQYEQSFAFYLKMIDEDAPATSAVTGEDPALHQLTDNLQVRHQRWMRARIDSLLREVPPADRKKMDQIIEQRWTATREEGSIGSLRKFIEYFGEHPTANQARLQLAGKLWNAGELLEAELILTGLLQDHDPPTAARATAQLARLFQDAGHLEESAKLYQRLRTDFANVDCGGKSGSEVVAQLPADSQIAAAIAPAAEWPMGRIDVTHHDKDNDESPKLGYSSYQRVYPTQLEAARGVLPEGMTIVLDRRRRVILRDGMGRTVASEQLNGSRTARYFTTNYSITHTKTTGHLALVSIGFELFAIDLLKTTSNGGRRVLWNKDLSSPIVNSATSRQHSVAKLRGSPWGGHRYFAGNSEGKPIAGFTCATAQGVVYRRWDQLICFDALRPDRVHWVRDGIDNGAEVFGDDAVVVVLTPEKPIAQLYSALDGRGLGEFEVGKREEIWATLGRKILRWRADGEENVVEMLDPWDAPGESLRGEPVLWSHRFAKDAKGTRVERNELAVMGTDGAFTLLDLESGKIRFETQLEAEPELSTLFVQRGTDHYLVVANRPIDNAPAGLNVQPVPGGYGPQGQFSPLIKGRIYAIERSDGRQRWQVPAVVEHFGLPLDQPTQAPLVTFMRNVSVDNDSPSRSWKTEVVCLDRRDGRVAFHQRDIPGNTQVYAVRANPDEHSADVLLAGESFTLNWTDAPRPPEPPAQLRSAKENDADSD